MAKFQEKVHPFLFTCHNFYTEFLIAKSACKIIFDWQLLRQPEYFKMREKNKLKTD